MTSIKKGIAPLLIICGIVCIGIFNFRFSSHTDSESFLYPSNASYEDFEDFHDILSIEITYTAHSDSDFVYRFYKITKIDGVYYSNAGKKIYPYVIHSLADSFTDLYESEYQHSYNNIFTSRYRPHFTVVITLADGKVVTVKSDSSYHCFIPWNIEYNGTSYVQYNGKIPSALLKLLGKIDKEWTAYDKEIQWGCYPAAVPEHYTDLSFNFPVTEPVLTLKEERGITHVLWKADINPIGVPVYSQGTVFVTTEDQLRALDSKTGEPLWEYPFEQEIVPSLRAPEQVVVHNGTVYVGAPFWVYSLDGETGALLWKYKTATQYVSLALAGENLIALTGGVTCLHRETGELLWEITDDTWNETFYADTILLEGLSKDGPYHALIDTHTGETLWKGTLFDIKNPVYHEGVLYFSRVTDGKFGSLDVHTMEEWSYWYGKPLAYVDVFEDRILLVFFNKEGKSLDSLLVLDLDRFTLWKYTYPKGIPWEPGYSMSSSMSEGTLFISREGGIIEAFNAEDGEKLWETEVRGTTITSFEVYNEKIYVSANDGRLYCLEVETGEISWVFAAEHALVAFPEDALVYVSLIEDGFLFVATIDGNLYAFSV